MVEPSPKLALTERKLWRPRWGVGEQREMSLEWLDKNENPDPELRAVVGSVLQDMPLHVHSSYPELGPLYRKLATFLDTGVENLILSNGSDGLIRSVFDAFVDAGDPVIHTDPTFAMYSVYCDIFGARPLPIEYRRNGDSIEIDVESVLRLIEAERPSLVCVPNPDSPTGSLLSHDSVSDVLEVAARAGSVVLIDEAYYPFCEHTVIEFTQRHDNLIVTRSTGKAWGMAGLRVGIGIGAKAIVHHLHRVRPMYECNAVGAYVLCEMIERYDEVEKSVDRLKQGMSWFGSQLRELGYKVLNTQGNFLHVAFGSDEEAIAESLKEVVYYRRATPHPCLEGYSRFSATTKAGYEPIVDRIKLCRQEGKINSEKAWV